MEDVDAVRIKLVKTMCIRGIRTGTPVFVLCFHLSTHVMGGVGTTLSMFVLVVAVRDRGTVDAFNGWTEAPLTFFDAVL
jgi:hypothetical protein